MSGLRLPQNAAPACLPRQDLGPSAPSDPSEGADGFHRFMRTWATGITVVTTRRQGRSVGCTVTAFTSVSLRPALLLVSLTDDSRTLATLRARGLFGINVLAADQPALADHFATAPGDRFATVPHHLVDGIPLLDAALATAVCRVEHAWPVADHVLVLGRPRHYGTHREVAPLIRFNGTSVPGTT
ncbi:flavin reductase family protein [Streptomyces sp. NPDC059070]|uniref:flavin reductase family protein n=1 Tax=unclassified Streptomyces TaxID=2593676 RepID=UPI0034E1FC0C